MGQGDCVGQLVWGLLTSWDVRDAIVEPGDLYWVKFLHVKSCWSLLLNCFVISSFLSLFAQSHLCKQKQLFLQMWMPRLDEPKPAQIISKGLKKQPSKTNKNPHQT